MSAYYRERKKARDRRSKGVKMGNNSTRIVIVMFTNDVQINWEFLSDTKDFRCSYATLHFGFCIVN